MADGDLAPLQGFTPDAMASKRCNIPKMVATDKTATHKFRWQVLPQ
jgi:hypothetical protein